jgi:hypothetical protein
VDIIPEKYTRVQHQLVCDFSDIVPEKYTRIVPEKYTRIVPEKYTRLQHQLVCDFSGPTGLSIPFPRLIPCAAVNVT